MVIRVVPILHDRLDVAAWVRRHLAESEPAAVAVELPTTLETAVLQAVRRLPRISLVVSEEPGEEALVWTVAPGDPFAEALRWALERQRPVFFIDPDVPYAERHADPLPDPYALWQVGPERYFAMVADALSRAPATRADEIREAGMAHHLEQARRRLADEGAGGEILALVGAAHARRLEARLGRPTAIPFARTRRTRVTVRHLHPESLTALLPDPPLAHAVFELSRSELPPEPPLEATLARKLSLVAGGLRLVTRDREAWGVERQHRVAEHAAHRALLDGRPDRAELGAVVWRVASRSYEVQTEEAVSRWQRRIFFDFAHRYARAQGLLVPGLYEWVVAARGVADDNLAWETFEVARAYPWQEPTAEIDTATVDGDELDLGTRTVRFRRRFFRVKERPRLVPVERRPMPEDPADWLEGFTGSLCSFPPEDLVIEDYGRFLKQKAVSLLSAERKRVEPFSTSLLDGIDLKETLRHVEDSRVWVQEIARAPGQAGSVVVIFDRDPDNERYPYLMTWLGEHEDESDMAFYATHPGEQVVGPGILRASYGGFLMSYLPGRLYDVWMDPDYRGAREKSHVLVMAGIDYSREKLVVHVARKPPAEVLTRYAAARGKRLVHVPLGSLSQTTLKKIRVLHILSGHDKRAIAKNYVW